MGFNYRKNGLKIEIIIRDDNFKKIDTFKFNIHEFNKFFNIIRKKYGIRTDSDIDWAID